MLYSKTNKIPDKEITAVIGYVSVKVLEIDKWARKDFALGLLERKIINMGGNAIINLSVRRVRLDMKNTYSGLAVIAEDIRPFWEIVNCAHCGKPNKLYYLYCMHCGKKHQKELRTKLCTKCGRLNRESAQFCSACGRSL